jgi:hypothetical protein
MTRQKFGGLTLSTIVYGISVHLFVKILLELTQVWKEVLHLARSTAFWLGAKIIGIGIPDLPAVSNLDRGVQIAKPVR